MGKITLLDGGISRELVVCGAELTQPEWSAGALIEAPEAVLAAHCNFVAAGAQVVTVNAYALVPFHIGEARFESRGADLADQAARLARQAVEGRAVQVAGCIPPLFGSYEPQRFDARRAPAMLDQLITAQSPHVDLWLIETTSSLEEAEAALTALRGEARPVWLAFTLQDDAIDAPVLRSGESVAAAAEYAARAGVDAILFNCSQPEVMAAAVSITARAIAAVGSSAEVGVYANAFDDHKDGGDQGANDQITELRPDMTPEAYLRWADTWVAAGATIIRGCCGIGPDHIAALHDHFAE
jgi:S-methylmethionine-dependent homocysteine/selenocysteine methylase